ncbi:MAG: ATP-binding protein [Bryobacteraceae bacterium]|nr:ATP-binding protein [Bryobacteraceae bacterium]
MPNAESTPEILYDQYLESTLASVDASEEAAKSVAERLGYDEEETYHIGYAVREAVVNAVVHGNLYSANKRVRLRMERSGGSLEVIVEDEGQGFEESQQADPLARENLLSQSGRGLLIIRAFMDELRIGRTEAGGTRLWMRKSLPAPR